jgi:hypothetical protein
MVEFDCAVVEFDCADCGRHIVHFGASPGEPLRCASCLFMPGWYEDHELRRVFEPDPDWRPPAKERDG